MYELFPPKEDKTYIPPKDLKYRKFHKGFKNHLRSHLKIYPKYVQMAQETFRKVAKSMKISPEKLTYVGMHHRQTGILIRKFQRKKQNSQFFLISYNFNSVTDFADFAKLTSGAKPIKKSMFYDAMESFREEYDPIGEKQVIFHLPLNFIFKVLPIYY